MSTTYVSVEIRRLVAARADNRCEYCKALRDELYFNFQIDHIIAEAHKGATSIENLALCCRRCNSNKGPNLASVLPLTNEPIRLFNPRRDEWRNHFRVEESGLIIPKSDIGAVTAELLRFNSSTRKSTRAIFKGLGFYDSF